MFCMILPVTSRLLLTAALTISSCACAAERSVPCNTLPEAVQQHSKSLLEPGTTVKGCVKDSSGSKTTYEMALVTPKGSKDVTFSPAGEVLEVEEEVDPSTLPPPVTAAFTKAATGGKLGKVESLSRQGKLISYESTVERGGRHREVAFTPDGARIKAE
jgi:hypothetical protein